MFKWLVGRIGRLVGRSVNALYYNLLYRELLAEMVALEGDDIKTACVVFKEYGREGARESAQRQRSVLKYFPGDPLKLLSYLEILWQVIFGMKMGEHEIIHEDVEGKDFPLVIYRIQRCPICGGFGDDPEDAMEVKEVGDQPEKYACGIMGQLETVANFILDVHESPYMIFFHETQCIARGDRVLEITCEIAEKSEVDVARARAEVKPEKPLISIEKIDEFMEAPLERFKTVVTELIEQHLAMTPKELLAHFENYEDDMIRIIGYLGVHLLNEYGGFVEKLLANETLAKVAGYWFKSFRDFIQIFLPREVIQDYHQLFVEFIEGLAPDTMVETFANLDGFTFISLVLEGNQMALENLGINFDELKENVWEELRAGQEEDFEDAFSPETVLSIFKELFNLGLKLLGLPVRALIAGQHAQTKTVVESARDIYEEIKEHGGRIFDIIGDLKSEN